MNREFTNNPNRKIPVREYKPSSYEEDVVWRIATHVEDTDIRPLLKVLRQHGLSVLESAFMEFRDLEGVVDFTNKPGFFMHLVKKRLGRGYARPA